jgi:hypothetical protein
MTDPEEIWKQAMTKAAELVVFGWPGDPAAHITRERILKARDQGPPTPDDADGGQ